MQPIYIMEQHLHIHVPQVDCIVLGAGLSGLAAAYQLKQLGKSFLIIEKDALTGGVIGSSKQDGFVIEHGPNSLVLTPEIKTLCDTLGIADQLIHAKPISKVRQIIWNNKLHTLKPSPLTIITTTLLSFKGKLRLLKELFINSKATDGESVHDFFTRRLGHEAAQRMAGAIVSGIYAGDPKQLEMAAIFPRLVELEKEHGSIIKGLAKSKGPAREIVSFKNGLQTLTDALTQEIIQSLVTQSTIQSISQTVTAHWEVNYQTNGSLHTTTASNIISTIPAYALKNIVGLSLPQLDITYNPMLTLQVAIPRKAFEEKTIGFGFLASPFERKDFIGVMLNGHIFEIGINEQEALINFFVKPDNCGLKTPQEIFEQLCTPLFKEWTGIKEPLKLIAHRHWQQAIPQKVQGHSQWLQSIAVWETVHLGFHIAGNYRHGVSLGDCVADHQKLVATIYSGANNH